MSELQSEFDVHNRDVVSSIDDLPLWSAPFGLKLLDVVDMRQALRVLDVGCGTGFPLVDLSQRLGATCTTVGIDPWVEALGRARRKLQTWGIGNVELVQGVAEAMPFDDASFDLVVSNNGTNNVDDEPRVFSEIARVARPGAQFAFTLNLPGTMCEFYDVYRAVLGEREDAGAAQKVDRHIHTKRKPVAEVVAMVETAGFRINEMYEDEFSFRYTDGTTMLRHFFIRLGFKESWMAIPQRADTGEVFEEVENRLNDIAKKSGGLRLTIPWVCVDCRKH